MILATISYIVRNIKLANIQYEVYHTAVPVLYWSICHCIPEPIHGTTKRGTRWPKREVPLAISRRPPSVLTRKGIECNSTVEHARNRPLTAVPQELSTKTTYQVCYYQYNTIKWSTLKVMCVIYSHSKPMGLPPQGLSMIAQHAKQVCT